MIYANYSIIDIFNYEQFISATTKRIDERSIRTAFKAMKKYNAVIFIDTGDNTQVRYELDNDQNTLKRTNLTFYNGVQNEDAPVLIDYNTALKQELKKAKDND